MKWFISYLHLPKFRHLKRNNKIARNRLKRDFKRRKTGTYHMKYHLYKCPENEYPD